MAAKFTARRVGLTLLELILALSLSVVLLFSVGMALRLYWRSFDVKRTNVEQAHLARAILRRMEDDFRSAVQYTPVDLSGLESMTSSSALAGAFAGMTGTGSPSATAGGGAPGGATGGGAGAGGGNGAGTGGGGSSTTPAPNTQTPTGQGGGSSSTGAAPNSSTTKTGTASTKSGSTTSGASATSGGGAATSGQSATGESTEAETTTEAPPAVVGLYGSANQVQFDVSRLPRVDEYSGGSPTSMVQIPSDVKTVSYYVRGESAGGGIASNFITSGSTAPGSSEPSTTGRGRGLMRLEMDRAVSAYGESNGSVAAGYDNAKLLADEVTSITFRYWNGTEWASDWNSDEMGGLPLAIEVVMTMADPNAVPADSSVQNFTATADTSTDSSYRIVVNLPSASLPPPVEEPAEEIAPAMGGASSTGSGATGAGATGSSGGSTPSYGTGSKIGATK